ncbi:MAG TPA: prepilin peptidase [Candidatus Hydrogenedens sp.]|nr:prepilin peptidase [Candidatus Hydrogenedens sp.]
MIKNIFYLDSFNILFTIIAGMFGAVFGSFCNVCIYRFPKGESILRPGSHCPKCQHPIAWYDNIPLFSWLILRGKCRYCKASISIQYPLIELLTAILFMIVYLKFRFSLATIVYCLLSVGLVVVVIQDLQTWTIPDEVTLTGIILGIGVSLLGMFFPGQGLLIRHPLEAIDGVALGTLLICLMDLIVILLLKKPGMGFGDVKLLSMLGAFLGWQGVLGSLMIGSMIGSIVGFFIIGYYRLFQKGVTSAETEKMEGDNNDYYPIEPITGLFLGLSSIYLIVRVIIFLTLYQPDRLPAEIIKGFSYLIIAFFLFSLLIAILSLWVWKKQYRTTIPKASENADEEVEISLQAHYIPFGPYLSLGGFIFLLFGPELISKYIKIISI